MYVGAVHHLPCGLALTWGDILAAALEVLRNGPPQERLGFWWLTSQKAGRSGEAAQVRDALSARAMELLASWAVRNICPAATLPTNPHPPV